MTLHTARMSEPGLCPYHEAFGSWSHVWSGAQGLWVEGVGEVMLVVERLEMCPIQQPAGPARKFPGRQGYCPEISGRID